MEKEPEQPKITGQDLETKILKLRAMREMLKKQKLDLVAEAHNLEAIDDRLNYLSTTMANNLSDQPKPQLEEEWLKLWQEANALEAILTDWKQSIDKQKKNYEHALNEAGLSDRDPKENQMKPLN